MKYIASLNADKIVTDISLVPEDYSLKENEIDLGDIDVESIPAPCKYVDGEFIPVEFVATGSSDGSENIEDYVDPMTLSQAQIKVLSARQEFLEDCIVEMAMKLYS